MLRVFLLLLALPTGLLAAEPPSLPSAWHGEWKGELTIFAPNGKTSQVPLTLLVKPTDGGLTWKATYGGAKPVVKDYTLKAGEKPGQFVIDEGGGLLLPCRLDGNTLVSVFALGEVVLTARYELREGKLLQEVTSARKTEAKLPGGVVAYDVQSVQRAELAKAK